MSQTPQPIRGMQSLLGEEADRMHAVVSAFDRVRRLYGFKRVEVPVLEETAVFARTMGETTDVVSKEMYSFEDRSGDSVTLRPEFTAGIARAYLSEGWKQFAPLRVATHGPAFRYERPQKGRFRQFHQLDAEIIGTDDPQSDVELLAFGSQLLAELGLGDSAILKLNTLGDPETREAWRAALHEHFASHRAALSEDSRTRLDRNPLRILDSKAHEDWPIVDAAPGIDAFLTAEAQEFFAQVTEGLDAVGVRWERAPRLVRGLDYYRHTAFEFITDQLGAQGTVLAGGRYDGLMEQLGGAPTPAVGWAAGIERLAMMIDAPVDEGTDVAIVVEDDAEMDAAWKAATALRHAGLSVDLVASGSPRKRFDRAVKKGAREMLIIGRDKEGQSTSRVRAEGESKVAGVLGL